jgi:serine/threonine protein kinase
MSSSTKQQPNFCSRCTSVLQTLPLLLFLQTSCKPYSVPNITHMWSAYASQDKFHILMEYCSGGNLLEQLKAAAAPMAEQQLAAQVSWEPTKVC